MGVTGMSVKDELKTALTAAMKARDEVALSALRQALSAISVAETAGSEVTELGDDQVLAVLAVEVKKHHEAADGATGMKAMGRVVSAVRAKAGTSADGAKIAAQVKAALAG